ncbi:MAG: RES domain-containing protein [Actinomycetota bacterium]|nr:RES domain-containing protein [Actinomycetota bacterium]
MLLHRVFPYLPSASTGQPGHPLYVHPAQGAGRFDNPSHYLAWYMAAEAVSAIGESFAHLSEWRDEVFEFPHIPGSRKALGIYDLPDDLPYVDLDDPQRLVDLGVRPSQIVERNRPYTQALALRIYIEAKYKGIRWWSFHRPRWRVYCLWEIDPDIVQVDDLTVAHIAVDSAARTLARRIA